MAWLGCYGTCLRVRGEVYNNKKGSLTYFTSFQTIDQTTFPDIWIPDDTHGHTACRWLVRLEQIEERWRSG
jgi:hypothetical protein